VSAATGEFATVGEDLFLRTWDLATHKPKQVRVWLSIRCVTWLWHAQGGAVFEIVSIMCVSAGRS
jgi:hypothetical protein